MTSKLGAVHKGKLKEAARIVVTGVEGVGKSSLAADAPEPIFFDIDAGTGQLEVARYPFRPEDPKRGHVPENLSEIRDGVNDLITSPHHYKTLVIDTADALEKLVHKFVVNRDKPKSKDGVPGIESYGYGRGFQVALDELRGLCADLDRLRLDRGMQIMILAHSTIKRFEPPTSAAYDRYTMRTNEKFAGFLREWADICAFACFEEGTTDLLGDRTKGVATGRRLLRLKRSATHDAKSRYALPDTIEMTLTNPWAPFAKALSDAQNMGSDELCAAIRAEAERIGDDVTKSRAEENIKKFAGDVTTLQRIVEMMREKQSMKEGNENE